MAKLLIKHPELRPYRLPLFEAVACEHDIRFLFNRPPDCDQFEHVVIQNTKSSMWRDPHSVNIFLRETVLGIYDVLVISTPTASASIIAALIARIRHKKVIVWTETWRGAFNGWKGLIRRSLFWSVYRLTHAHFVTSSKTDKFLRQNFYVRDSSLFFSPQCNLDLIDVMPAVARFPVPESFFVFLYLGRIIPVKGLDYLIRAFALVQSHYSDAFLLVVGDGDELDRCKQLANDLNITRCLFHGAIPDSNMSMKAAYYKFCDVLILPSRICGNHYEGWGLVIGEAMSMRKPVITTDAVGCSDDMIQDGVNGFIVHHSSVVDLANAMKNMLDNRDKLPEMGKASREIFEKQINYSKMSRAFLDSINFALNYKK